MKQKFEDLMKPGLGSRLAPGREDAPDAVRWINLLSATGFTMFCTLMSEPGSWGDGLFFFMFWGMIFGPVVFLMTQGFSDMAGGKAAWWVSIACMILMAVVCGYFLLGVYGLAWLF